MKTPQKDDDFTITVRPGDDFYTYVNDAWLKQHPIPPEKARMAAMTILHDENIEKLKQLLETAEERVPENIARVTSFYVAAMDEKTVETSGLGALKEVLDVARSVQNSDDLRKYVGQRHAAGLSMLWRIGLDVDDKDSSRYVLRIDQSGLGLPDRDYYLTDDAQFEHIRTEYEQFLVKILTLLGEKDAASAAVRVLAIETALATVSATAVERRDVQAKYNVYDLVKLKQEFPGLDWPGYMRVIGAEGTKELMISQPKFMKTVFDLLETTPIDDWRLYLLIHTIFPFLAYLPHAYSDANFAFYGTVISGTQKQEVRYRRAISQCMRHLPLPLGQLYVSRYFDETAKQSIYDLVSHLQDQFKTRVTKLDWMSEATKERALGKLATFTPLLGYPDTWRDFGRLKLGSVYVDNVLSVIAFDWKYDMSRLTGTVDRREWLMSPALVNANYWSNMNSISFPAGILQPPFFDAKGDFATNYGAIGAVIGHEITHGFDDKGSQFDEKGNLVSWWSKEDRARFDARAKQLSDQFDAYVVEGHHVNGALTLGENIADLGGLLLAYDALQQKLKELGTRELVDGLTPEQRFFIAWARGWRGQTRPEFTLRLLISDPHAPDKLRVNGPLGNIDAFYDAFAVQPEDAGYRSPDQRVRIW